nr:YadA [Salmonella enterica subsp. enterica serovar Rissen]
MTGYSDDRWEAPQRAARLAAAVKRYKTSEMLRFIFATVAHDPDPDLTPLAVKRLCKALFGRTGSQWLIVDIFGEKAAPQQRQQPGVREKIAAKYRHEAGRHWSATLAEIERIKRLYQSEIQVSREKQS